MDTNATQTLITLLQQQQSAALGTLRKEAPSVSYVLFAASADLTGYYLLISSLAHHTQDLLNDPRAGLMITQGDGGSRDPQTLARISMQGLAEQVSPLSLDYAAARQAYLDKFPQAAQLFGFGDFGLFQFQPQTARYVAGFGRIYNLTIKNFEGLV